MSAFERGHLIGLRDGAFVWQTPYRLEQIKSTTTKHMSYWNNFHINHRGVEALCSCVPFICFSSLRLRPGSQK